MTIEQDIIDLQKQITNLKGKTDSPFSTALTVNPFSRLDQLEQAQGSTGSSTVRRLPLAMALADESGDTFVVDNHGSLSNTTHFELPDPGTTTIYFETIILPTDYVQSTVITINWLYSNEGTTGNIRWKPLIRSLSTNATSLVTLFDSNITTTVPPVANTTTIVSTLMTGFPERDTFITGYVRRNASAGDDTNNSTTSLWSTWIEYLAYD